jgi:hypothetical protein
VAVAVRAQNCLYYRTDWVVRHEVKHRLRVLLAAPRPVLGVPGVLDMDGHALVRGSGVAGETRGMLRRPAHDVQRVVPQLWIHRARYVQEAVTLELRRHASDVGGRRWHLEWLCAKVVDVGSGGRRGGMKEIFCMPQLVGHTVQPPPPRRVHLLGGAARAIGRRPAAGGGYLASDLQE